MKKLKRILHRLLFPGTWVVLLSVPVAAGLLVYTFLAAGEDSPIAYPAYVVSAYSLTVVCVNFIPLLKKMGLVGGTAAFYEPLPAGFAL